MNELQAFIVESKYIDLTAEILQSKAAKLFGFVADNTEKVEVCV